MKEGRMRKVEEGRGEKYLVEKGRDVGGEVKKGGMMEGLKKGLVGNVMGEVLKGFE